MTTIHSNRVNAVCELEGKDVGQDSFYLEGISEQSLQYPWGSSIDFYADNHYDDHHKNNDTRNKNDNNRCTNPDNYTTQKSDEVMNSDYFSPIKILPNVGQKKESSLTSLIASDVSWTPPSSRNDEKRRQQYSEFCEENDQIYPGMMTLRIHDIITIDV